MVEREHHKEIDGGWEDMKRITFGYFVGGFNDTWYPIKTIVMTNYDTDIFIKQYLYRGTHDPKAWYEDLTIAGNYKASMVFGIDKTQIPSVVITNAPHNAKARYTRDDFDHYQLPQDIQDEIALQTRIDERINKESSPGAVGGFFSALSIITEECFKGFSDTIDKIVIDDVDTTGSISSMLPLIATTYALGVARHVIKAIKK